ncbi:MAG: site-2 protease family protein [Leptospiraceae bacterium]|nr:site-2 protease family protein [Leptospiraceae bacterium]MCP5513455.1 site-2 protease family protein [Leptospiraceae bacterium]
MLLIIIGAVLMLGVSIFIHELGHLLCGKLVGVDARIFSIGYGKGIWKKRIGNTTYQITGFPIGGYVMFKGDQYGKRLTGKKGELLSTPPLKRMIPVLGGPLFNLFLGFFLFFLLALMGDVPYSNKIFIDPYNDFMPAYRSGLRTGDTIVSINGKPTPYFEDIFNTISLSGGDPIDLEYEREGEKKQIRIAPDIFSGGGRPTIGIEPYGKRSVVATFTTGEQFRQWVKETLPEAQEKVSGSGETSFSPTRAIAFLKDGDEILSVENIPISTVKELQQVLGKFQNKEVEIKILRKSYPLLTPWAREEVSVRVPVLGAYQLEFSDMMDVNEPYFKIPTFNLSSYDPALEKKLKNLSFNGKTFASFGELKKTLKSDTEIQFQLGKLEYSATIKIIPIGLLGFRPSMKIDFEKNPGEVTVASAFTLAIDKITDNVTSSVKGLSMILTGILSAKDNLSGPIGIVQLAGLTLEYGLFTYLDFAGRISIALMIMNLLPIPVADGGHLVLYLYEAVSGRPVPPGVIDVIFKFGLIFLLSLGLFVTFNDFLRVLK